MKVNLIAYTKVNDAAMWEAFNGFSRREFDTSDADHLAEAAGRQCYLSFDRPNPATRENADYLDNVISKGHESVLAHASFTFAIQGVSRSLTHELIRSRFLAFSEVSQRYVDPEGFEMVTPPALDAMGEDIDGSTFHMIVMDAYAEIIDALTDEGLSRKQAREAARAVLPGAMETRMVVSGNVRAWRDFIKQRLSPFADAEIQALAYKILKDIEGMAPGSVQDLTPLITEYEARQK